jgi:hypothetical protein
MTPLRTKSHQNIAATHQNSRTIGTMDGFGASSARLEGSAGVDIRLGMKSHCSSASDDGNF